MNDKEVDLFFKEFSDRKLVFDSYYKYSFTFVWENTDWVLRLSYGMCNDDIYRYSVSNNEAKDMPTSLEIAKELWHCIQLDNKHDSKRNYYWSDL